jgi:hypothetical protein|tara:strand:+ start:235 stop:594 length:360 start_codon:yes stop_codon:yes gene_type:complete
MTEDKYDLKSPFRNDYEELESFVSDFEIPDDDVLGDIRIDSRKLKDLRDKVSEKIPISKDDLYNLLEYQSHLFSLSTDEAYEAGNKEESLHYFNKVKTTQRIMRALKPELYDSSQIIDN